MWLLCRSYHTLWRTLCPLPPTLSSAFPTPTQPTLTPLFLLFDTECTLLALLIPYCLTLALNCLLWVRNWGIWGVRIFWQRAEYIAVPFTSIFITRDSLLGISRHWVRASKNRFESKHHARPLPTSSPFPTHSSAHRCFLLLLFSLALFVCTWDRQGFLIWVCSGVFSVFVWWFGGGCFIVGW